MSIKMKGLLKGLRYISQIFEEEEDDKEMQIGLPTDVKHVAHIGWDGPSVNSPSWMKEFKSQEANPVDPLQNGVEEINPPASQESSPKSSSVRSSTARDLPGLPKSSRRQPSMDSIGSTDSPIASPNHKTRSSRRRQKQKETTSPRGGESSGTQSLPNIPKKSRRKKSKDADNSLKSSLKPKEGSNSRHSSRHGSDDGSLTKQYNVEANSSTGFASFNDDEMKAL